MKLNLTRFAVALAAVAIAMLGVLSTADAQGDYAPENPVEPGATYQPPDSTRLIGAKLPSRATPMLSTKP